MMSRIAVGIDRVASAIQDAATTTDALQDPGLQASELQTVETFRFLAMPAPWIIGLIILPLTVLFAWWCYGGLKRLERGTRITLAALRFLAILVCLFLLFQPALETVRYTKQETQVHVLVDDSASMRRKDTYPDETQSAALREVAGVTNLASISRAELVQRVLEKPGGMLEKLAATHAVRLYRFERKALPIGGLGELSARGSRTAIGDALNLHLSSASTQLDAVVVVSDGRNNSGADPVETAGKYRIADVPIYTLGVGDPLPPKNAWLVGPPGPKEALREEEVTFEVVVRAEGLTGRPVTVTLSGSLSGSSYLPLSSAQGYLADDGQPLTLRLTHAFDREGDWSLRFKLTELPEESSIEDNVDTRFLRVNDEKIRVLVVDHRPRWQYRYLHTALERVDPSIVMQALLLDASPGFIQEHSPDVPSLQRLPRDLDEMMQYHVILLGDVPPEDLAPTSAGVSAWLDDLVQFVERGGGVGFLWGKNAMPERYRGTRIEDLLPVVLEDRAAVPTLTALHGDDFQPQLDAPSQPHEIAALLSDPGLNEHLWHREFEPFVTYYPVRQSKVGGQVVLRHPTDKNRFGTRPLLVAREYPRGRTLFLATDETWVLRNPWGELHLDRFWRNVTRYLAGGRLSRRDDRVELRLDKTVVETGDKLRISLLMQTDTFEPEVREQAAVFFRAAEGTPERRTLRAVPSELGSFRGGFTMEETGAYSVLVFEDDNPAGRVMAREDVLVVIPDREMAETSQDEPMLRAIAAASRSGEEELEGAYRFLAEADALGDELASRTPLDAEEDRSTRPLWDAWWTLFVLLGILGLEWILRKRARLV